MSLAEGGVGNVYYRKGSELFLGICLGKVKSDARPDQLVTFTRCLRETLSIENRDLPSAAFNQTNTFQLLRGVRDGWSLDTQHFGQQVLSDRQCVAISAVAHHQQPTRQSLLEAVRTVAGY
jgi:hypothetical protein